ncbi:MAG: hypothetical protein ACKOWF_07890 [Chloroflexota bacterium]
MDAPLVVIAIAPNEIVARLWEAALADEGIRSLLRPLGPGYGAWASAATLEHEIAVLATDADRAREVLAALDDDP